MIMVYLKSTGGIFHIDCTFEDGFNKQRPYGKTSCSINHQIVVSLQDDLLSKKSPLETLIDQRLSLGKTFNGPFNDVVRPSL